MAEQTHDGLGLRLVTADDITTRTLEAWSREMRVQTEKAQSAGMTRGVSLFEDNVLTVRAAIKAGVMIEPVLTQAQVGDLPTLHTRWYAQRLDALYRELTEIPKA